MSRGVWTRKLPQEETRLPLPAPQRLGVLSDTHGRCGEILNLVGDFFRRARVDLILHAGDVGHRSVLDALGQVAPVVAVCGNADPLDLIESLPDRARIDVGSRSVLLLHGHHGKTAMAAAKAAVSPGVDLIVYGHSHKPWISREGKTILFNPGSPAERRWHPHFGIGLIEVGDDAIDPELILFDNARQLEALQP